MVKPEKRVKCCHGNFWHMPSIITSHPAMDVVMDIFEIDIFADVILSFSTESGSEGRVIQGVCEQTVHHFGSGSVFSISHPTWAFERNPDLVVVYHTVFPSFGFRILAIFNIRASTGSDTRSELYALLAYNPQQQRTCRLHALKYIPFPPSPAQGSKTWPTPSDRNGSFVDILNW